MRPLWRRPPRNQCLEMAAIRETQSRQRFIFRAKLVSDYNSAADAAFLRGQLRLAYTPNRPPCSGPMRVQGDAEFCASRPPLLSRLQRIDAAGAHRTGQSNSRRRRLPLLAMRNGTDTTAGIKSAILVEVALRRESPFPVRRRTRAGRSRRVPRARLSLPPWRRRLDGCPRPLGRHQSDALAPMADF